MDDICVKIQIHSRSWFIWRMNDVKHTASFCSSCTLFSSLPFLSPGILCCAPIAAHPPSLYRRTVFHTLQSIDLNWKTSPTTLEVARKNNSIDSCISETAGAHVKPNYFRSRQQFMARCLEARDSWWSTAEFCRWSNSFQ